MYEIKKTFSLLEPNLGISKKNRLLPAGPPRDAQYVPGGGHRWGARVLDVCIYIYMELGVDSVDLYISVYIEHFYIYPVFLYEEIFFTYIYVQNV